MLKSMRTMGNNPVTKILLGLLAAAFALWGIGDYLVHTTNDAAVTVNGEDIGMGEVEKTYDARKRLIEQMSGQTATPALLAELRMPDTVMAEVVNRTVLRQTAESLGLVPANRQLRDEIRAMEPFHNDKGEFDLKRYEQMVGRAGLSTRQFEKEMAKDLGVRLMGQLIQVPAPAGEAVRPLAELETATTDLETLTLSPADVASAPAPEAAALEAFYKANPTLYTVPERRSFDMLRISAAKLAADITVPEDKVRTEYAKNPAAYAQPETREVRHILVADEALAKSLATQVTDEAAFIRLAGQYSEDPGSKANGGDIGAIRQADVVPEFGAIAFSLPVGQLSKPVKTDFGWHLIWVSKINKAEVPGFDAVKAQIAESIKAAEAEEAAQDLAEAVGDAVAGGEPLSKVAKDHGLELERQSLLPATANTVPQDILATVFSLQQGETSQPLTLGDGSTAYVQLTNIAASAVQPYDKVRDDVARDARTAQLAGLIQQRALQILNAMRTAAGPATLSVAAQSLRAPGSIGSLSVGGLTEAPRWIHPALTQIAALGEGQTLGEAVADGDKLVLVRVAKRTLGTPDAPALQEAAGAYRQRVQGDLEALLIGHLAMQADIKTNLPRLRQLFGPEYEPHAVAQ